MPAVVMDDDITSEEEKNRSGAHDTIRSDLLLSRITSAPASHPALVNHRDTADSRFRAQKAAASHFIPTTSHDPSTPLLKHHWSATSSPPLDARLDRPEKRLRLEEIELDDQARTFMRGEMPSQQAYSERHTTSLYSSSAPYRRSAKEITLEDSAQRDRFADVDDILDDVVRVISELQVELVKAFPSKMAEQYVETDPQDVTKRGLKHSLVWAANELRNMGRLAQGSSRASKAGLPSLTDVVPAPSVDEMRRASLSGPGAVATPMHEKRQVPILTDQPSRADELIRRSTEHPKDLAHPFSEPSLPPIIPLDEMRRSQAYEQSSAQSPHPSSGSSMFGPAHSPSQSQHILQRSLPSPQGSHFPGSAMLGPSTYGGSVNHAAHASHLQDLQHQISTKTLALQTLQREHDQLLAAFSRSQMRCNTLDKKSQVSDHEINTLTEEKIRLQQQVEALESQVEELQKSRDEMHKQSSADGAQWRQIMAMSSQLQVKSAEDARRFKSERESWDQERLSMEQRIQDLEERRAAGSIMSYQSAISESPSSAEDSLASMSVDVLRQEVMRLRARCADLELVVQEASGDTEQLDQAISAMSSLRQRLTSSKKRRDQSSG